MTPEHHPARPEYVRRGTPVIDRLGQPGFVANIDRYDDDHVRVVHDEAVHDSYGGVETYRLDLRDPTARAHAAMAWTEMMDSGIPRCRLEGAGLPDAAWRHVSILCRMRALDESVTPAEAKAALLWAEAVVDA